MTTPKLLVVELNEFNPELIAEASRQMPLPNLNRVLAMRHSETTTEDEIEHQGLDPWVQWVGVHTGRPTREHNIRRLGLTAIQTAPQIWELAGRAGLSWGVWGAMNAPRGNAPGCDFFMPDPWSFEERAYPESLNDLLALPRYAATNYLEIDRSKAAAAALRMIRFFLPPARWSLALRSAVKLLQGSASAGPNVHTFTTVFDYISVLCFTQLRAKHRPDFSLAFLNHIAHLQHQFWTDGDRLHPHMALGLKLSDEMMGMLLNSRGAKEAVIFTNGMRQKKVAGHGFFVYRQINPQRAIESLGITGARVEQCMTNDAHVLFDSVAEADRAEAILEASRLSDGHKVFYVEREAPNHLFYQLAFDHEVGDDVTLDSASGPVRFGEVFELICERTGAHEQRGDVFSEGADVPASLHNHELFDVMARHLGCVDARAPLRTAA